MIIDLIEFYDWNVIYFLDDIVLDIRIDGSFLEYIVNVKSDVDISSVCFCEEEFFLEVIVLG